MASNKLIVIEVWIGRIDTIYFLKLARLECLVRIETCCGFK